MMDLMSRNKTRLVAECNDGQVQRERRGSFPVKIADPPLRKQTVRMGDPSPQSMRMNVGQLSIPTAKSLASN